MKRSLEWFTCGLGVALTLGMSAAATGSSFAATAAGTASETPIGAPAGSLGSPAILMAQAQQSGAAQQSGTSERQNILFIAIDDLNDYIDTLGADRPIHTPNITALAQRGMLFTNAFAPGSSCTPSRTAILTGMSPFNSGLYSHNVDWRVHPQLPDLATLPRYFHDSGYATFGSGKLFHAHSYNYSGMTETSPLTTQTATDDPLEEKVSTVGRVHPQAEAKIVGPDGAILPIGEQGEYCSRGYAVMLGYWDDPERTAEAIDSEGWMHSGDLGTMDDQGYVRITGRIKDMVIRGGENIYPREIEEFLLTHPAISDVQVFGVSDQKYGEQVCSWVITKSGHNVSPEDIRSFCQGQIAHFKVPAHIKIVEAFTMTVTGKAQKFEMRKTMEAELATSDRTGKNSTKDDSNA